MTLFNFFVNPLFPRRTLRIVLFYSFALGAAYPRAISLTPSRSLFGRPYFSVGFLPTSSLARSLPTLFRATFTAAKTESPARHRDCCLLSALSQHRGRLS